MISTTFKWVVCDVCRLVDYDTTKKECAYCSMCDAWICQNDLSKWGRRMKAAVLRRFEPGFKGDPTYNVNERGELIK